MRQSPSTVAWLEPAQTALAREVADAAGLRLIAAGSPTRGQSGAVATALDCEAVDDLRAVLAAGGLGRAPERGVDLVWILSPGELGLDPSGNDARAVSQARAKGIRIASLEPIPPTALELAPTGWAGESGAASPAGAIRLCPLARLGRPFREAAEVLQELSDVRSALLESCCAQSEGSLGAGLCSAMDLLHRLFGEPESIDAAYVGPTRAPGVHPLPGETLRDLNGDLTANIRFSAGRAAAVAITNQAGRWGRSATLMAEHGRLRINDEGFEWVGPDGTTLDEMHLTAVAGRSPGRAALAISDALQRIADPAAPADGPTDIGAVLAMAQAALLSARTGQPESPATVRRMAGVT